MWGVDKCRSNGFTAIELVIALGITLAIITISVPAAVSSIKTAKLNGYARDISTYLNKARSIAVYTGKNICIKVDSTINGFKGYEWIYGASTATTPINSLVSTYPTDYVATASTTLKPSVWPTDCIVVLNNKGTMAYIATEFTNTTSDTTFIVGYGAISRTSSKVSVTMSPDGNIYESVTAGQ